jgi:hypothetical protein
MLFDVQQQQMPHCQEMSTIQRMMNHRSTLMPYAKEWRKEGNMNDEFE